VVASAFRDDPPAAVHLLIDRIREHELAGDQPHGVRAQRFGVHVESIERGVRDQSVIDHVVRAGDAVPRHGACLAESFCNRNRCTPASLVTNPLLILSGAGAGGGSRTRTGL
jgi:hypothetical protein